MTTHKRWLEPILWLCLFLAIISLVITVTINAYPLYVWEVRSLKIVEQVGLSREALLSNYQELMRYLNYPWVTLLQLPDFPSSASGAFHFYEVKKLFLLNYSVLMVTLLPALALLRKLRREQRLWQLVRPFQIGAVAPLVLGFLLLTNFNWFFETFHHVFFNNDDWLFDPSTDPIINALPAEYFMHCFILAFITLELIFIVGIYLGRRSLQKSAH